MKRPKTRRGVGRLAALASVALLPISLAACGGDSESGSEASAEGPLAGETIDFVVPYEPGGGFDLYVRLIAPYLAEELGAEIIVRNEPGAGGIAATNTTWSAEPDGLRIQLADTPGAILNELAGQEGARFEIAGFSWLARVAGEPEVTVTSTDGPESLEDLLESGPDPLVFSSVGVYDSDSIGAQLIGEVFGREVNVVTGFDGAPEAFSAVVRGDTNAMNVSAGSTAEYVSSGEGRALAILATEGYEELPDVPALSEVPGAEGGEDLIAIHSAVVESGRSIMAPPGLPEDILEAYREALEKVLNDPELLEEAAGQERVIQFLSGEEVQELVERAASDPDPAYMELIERAGENAAN